MSPSYERLFNLRDEYPASEREEPFRIVVQCRIYRGYTPGLASWYSNHIIIYTWNSQLHQLYAIYYLFTPPWLKQSHEVLWVLFGFCRKDKVLSTKRNAEWEQTKIVKCISASLRAFWFITYVLTTDQSLVTPINVTCCLSRLFKSLGCTTWMDSCSPCFCD